jgi:hypothetical protein
MGLRREWRFSYAAGNLAGPAEEKAKYHREREAWWLLQREKAEAELRQHGVEFRDYPVTGGTQVQPVLDPARQARLTECMQKIKHHADLAAEYETYLRAFRRSGDARLELDIDDVRFFGL